MTTCGLVTVIAVASTLTVALTPRVNLTPCCGDLLGYFVKDRQMSLESFLTGHRRDDIRSLATIWLMAQPLQLLLDTVHGYFNGRRPWSVAVTIPLAHGY